MLNPFIWVVVTKRVKPLGPSGTCINWRKQGGGERGDRSPVRPKKREMWGGEKGGKEDRKKKNWVDKWRKYHVRPPCSRGLDVPLLAYSSGGIWRNGGKKRGKGVRKEGTNSLIRFAALSGGGCEPLRFADFVKSCFIKLCCYATQQNFATAARLGQKITKFPNGSMLEMVVIFRLMLATVHSRIVVTTDNLSIP